MRRGELLELSAVAKRWVRKCLTHGIVMAPTGAGSSSMAGWVRPAWAWVDRKHEGQRKGHRLPVEAVVGGVGDGYMRGSCMHPPQSSCLAFTTPHPGPTQAEHETPRSLPMLLQAALRAAQQQRASG